VRLDLNRRTANELEQFEGTHQQYVRGEAMIGGEVTSRVAEKEGYATMMGMFAVPLA
jgi:hypothetical protein